MKTQKEQSTSKKEPNACKKKETGACKKKEQSAYKKAVRKFRRGIYVNREYSWLQFNKRVLDQANDPENPLLERCKFLSIFGSNLDEFFMVRVGSLYNESLTDPSGAENKTGLTAAKQLSGIMTVVRRLYDLRAATYASLRKQLSKAGVRILTAEELTPRQREECKVQFVERVLPLLTLMVLDAKHPMMMFENRKQYIVYELEKEGRRMLGVMCAGSAADRIFVVARGKKVKVILLEELLKAFGPLAFSGYTVKDRVVLRVTRNADLDTRVEDSDVERDFSVFMKKKIETRAKLGAVRLEADDVDSPLCATAAKLLKIDPAFCFREEHCFDYKFLFSIGNFLPEEQAAELRYPPFKGAVLPALAEAPSLIDYALRNNIFLSYPYDSMSPLVDLLDECARDRRVQAVQITIYRLASHSRIVEALCRACENGKQVTVVIELCARFDEESNLHYARKLQEAGCTIIYGMENYKVHSKIISVVLKEGDELRYLTHLGTGNYNESTSKQYTDLNFITADEQIGEDAVAFFRNIAICNVDFEYKKLLVAPETLKPGIIRCIDREIAKAQAGGQGRILAKMNSLTDKAIIDKLVEASCAGVKIDLIVRGICCLLPGVAGQTENIRVISVVGRFLEHSRVYCFGDESDRIMYISSADLMTRNTDKRVEIAAPVPDKDIERAIYAILRTLLADNVKARELGADGVYRPVVSDAPPLDAQQSFIRK